MIHDFAATAAEPVSAARTHLGRVRRVNEDRTLDRADRSLWAVADGMGGHAGGDIAAQAVVRALHTLADAPAAITPDTIETAIAGANATIRVRSAGAPCGTTIVAAHLDAGIATILWAGDSRAYLIRDGAARLVTSDHTIVQQLVDAGLLSLEDARSHPHANVVTRALGVAHNVALDRVSVETRPGDRLLLCSDGLWASLAIDDFRDTPALDEQADTLLARALARDGSDNISLVLIAA